MKKIRVTWDYFLSAIEDMNKKQIGFVDSLNSTNYERLMESQKYTQMIKILIK